MRRSTLAAGTLLAIICSGPPAAALAAKIQLLTPEAAATLTGKTVTVTRRSDKPSFIAATAGKASFALIGVGAMIAEGNSIVRQNEIADPADIVEAGLLPALSQQYSLKPAEAVPHAIATGNDLRQIVAAAPASDLVVDIRSLGWNFNYYPTHWGSYWVGYAVDVQLIDVKANRVLMHMPCGANTQKVPSPPTKDALLADRAALLKTVLASLAWNCTQLLAKEVFKVADGHVPEIPLAYRNPLGAPSTTDAASSTPSSSAATSEPAAAVAPAPIAEAPAIPSPATATDGSAPDAPPPSAPAQ